MATLSATPVRALVWLSEFSYLSLALLIACATLHLQLSVMAGRVKLARQLAGYYYDLVCVGAALVATHAYMYAFEIEWDQRYQMVVITGRHLPVLLYAWLTCYAWIFVIWIYLALASLVIIWAVLFNHGWVNGRWRRLVDSPRDTTRTMSTCRLVSSRLSRLVAALLASTSMTAISGLIRRCSLSGLEPSCRAPHPRSNCSKNDDKNTGSVLLGKDNAGSSNANDIGGTDYSHLETVLTHPTSPSPLRVKENPVRTLKLLLLRAMLGPISAMLCIAPSLVIQITAATRYLRPLYSSSAVIGSIQGILCFVYFVFSLEMAIYLNWVLDRAAM
ncbi:hypothetical protein EV182_003133 [Spiromyces aspiralis]|uniref:Uncharacterized protein n=1 Tax=Spiromyces aspiralis TaxID=68401 RepID=A0ACC1HUH9_9FUNG|nr:hypothetical protein EV182_003133 [Spiromyces aspiralis]